MCRIQQINHNQYSTVILVQTLSADSRAFVLAFAGLDGMLSRGTVSVQVYLSQEPPLIVCSLFNVVLPASAIMTFF